MLLARFFDEALMSSYCETRLGKSGKGTSATLAARIAACWAKPTFQPLAVAVAGAQGAADEAAGGGGGGGGGDGGGGGGDGSGDGTCGDRRGDRDSGLDSDDCDHGAVEESDEEGDEEGRQRKKRRRESKNKSSHKRSQNGSAPTADGPWAMGQRLTEDFVNRHCQLLVHDAQQAAEQLGTGQLLVFKSDEGCYELRRLERIDAETGEARFLPCGGCKKNRSRLKKEKVHFFSDAGKMAEVSTGLRQ
jgi:hypothetical protein